MAGKFRFAKKKSSKRVTVEKLAKKVAKLARNDNPEMKYAFTGYSQVQDWNGVLTELMNISQGTTVSTRVGNQCRLKSLDLIYRFRPIDQSGIVTCCRCMIILDTMDTNVAPIATDIMQTMGTALAPQSNYNLVNRQQRRFKILYDRKWEITLAQNAPTVRKRVKVDQICHYQGPNATDGTRNRVYLFTFCDYDNTALNKPFFYGTVTANFTDV